MKRKIKLEIFVNGMFYGFIWTNLWGGANPPTDEEITSEVETRLPYVKNKKYNIIIS